MGTPFPEIKITETHEAHERLLFGTELLYKPIIISTQTFEFHFFTIERRREINNALVKISDESVALAHMSRGLKAQLSKVASNCADLASLSSIPIITELSTKFDSQRHELLVLEEFFYLVEAGDLDWTLDLDSRDKMWAFLQKCVSETRGKYEEGLLHFQAVKKD
ncbi:MAG: hypothetical protein Q9168_007142 [Polycauliona sp. 1 TL-2023]